MSKISFKLADIEIILDDDAKGSEELTSLVVNWALMTHDKRMEIEHKYNIDPAEDSVGEKKGSTVSLKPDINFNDTSYIV